MGKALLGFFSPAAALAGVGEKKSKSKASPAKAVQGKAREAKKSRASLLATGGGVVGEELDPSNISSRNSLFGN